MISAEQATQALSDLRVYEGIDILSADELDEYLSDEDYVGFDEEEDRRARDAFGGR